MAAPVPVAWSRVAVRVAAGAALVAAAIVGAVLLAR
jgi:hypothetical protein